MRLPLLFCMFICTVAQLRAQRFFVEAHGTYQFAMGGVIAVSETWDTPSGGGPRVAEVERVNLNWGRGPGVGFLLGLELNEHLGVEIRSTYFPGERTEWEQSANGYVNEYAMVSRYLRLEPSLRMRSGSGPVSCYLAAGPSLALLAHSSTTSIDHSPLAADSEIAREYRGGIGWGAFGAMGMQYRTKGILAFFAEVNCTGQSWAPRRSEYTKYVIWGQDELSTLSTSEREAEYVASYSTDENNDPGSPTKSLRFQNPMSTWGFRAGVRFTFGRRPAPAVEAPVAE